MKYQYLILIVIATLFGLVAGGVGFLAARTLVLGSEFNLPLFGDINLQGTDVGNASIVIRNPKKIVVEQDTKVIETQGAVKRSIFAIYKYDKKKATSSILTNGVNLVGQNSEIGQAFVLTSDGWLLSTFVPDTAQKYSDFSTSTKLEILSGLKNNYIIMDAERNVYDIENFVLSKNNNLSYWKIKANDLPVRTLANTDELQNGQLLLVTNWDTCVALSSVVNKHSCEEKRIESSDEYDFTIELSETLDSNFYGSFLFNFNGDFLAIINSDGIAIPYEVFAGDIDSMLENGEIISPKLGLDYIDLNKYFIPDVKIEKGAYVVKYGVEPSKNTSEQQLLPGDIITHVNDIELNKDNKLNRIISRKLPGDMIDIKFLRDNNVRQISIILN